MRRICVFCETWESGGIEAFLANVICHMNLSGLEIDVVAARLGESVFTAPLEERGIRFYQLSGSTRRVAENHRLFRRLLEERDYDTVHLNAYQALSLGYLRLARRAGVPVRIAHSHNTQLRKSPTRPLKLALHRWAKKRYAKEPTHRWACSQGAAEFLFSPFADWAFVPNGIDVERFRFDPVVRKEARWELGLEGKLVVGNVGRLCYQKNQTFALDIFQEIHRMRPESVLLLVGQGEDRERLEEKAKSLGIENRVIFYGTTDRVERLYWAMDIFLFPSRFEGLPVTAIEAQAAGLPCLFSDKVTRECRIGEATWFLSLDAQPERWAETALGTKGTEERRLCADMVRSAGFDVEAVAERVREKWME